MGKTVPLVVKRAAKDKESLKTTKKSNRVYQVNKAFLD